MQVRQRDVIYNNNKLYLGSWVHCNDARLSRTTPDEVLKAQAYVLFYARRTGRSPVQNRTNPSTQPPSLKCSRKH